jgi:excisionase family DNA binding protein
MDQSDSPDPFLTVAEVAGILKLNQQTVRNWIEQGSLPALRVGRRVRIRRSDFERILEEGYTGVSGETSHIGGPTAEDFWGGEAVEVTAPVPELRGGGAAKDNPAAGNGNAA